ncbi:MAG: hypothetical protein IKX96_00585 [Firmicutes bacterium]|nr:hypothetical protein [Bacillota bacterium]
MRDILNGQIKTLRESSFKSREFNAWLKESSLWMSVYSCLRVKGVEMDKRQLVDVLSGGIVEDLPIDVYNFVINYKDLYKDMQACVSMQQSLDEKLLKRFSDILFGEDGYRNNNPIIYKWGYIAPHFNEIGNMLTEALRHNLHIEDAVDRAVDAHNFIAAIYPFGENSPVIALVALFYVLMSASLPLPAVTADFEEYNRIMRSDFEEHTNEFELMIERSLINRLDSVINLGREADGLDS